MDVAVVGAGWAGLAAAERLAQAGLSVTVYEAGHTLGGRARRTRAPALGVDIDNGQHILLGAYHETLALMARLGAADNDLLRLPLQLDSLAGDLRLRAPRWPAPWHLPAALARARGWPAADKLALLRQLAGLRLRGWRTPAGHTVQRWLLDGRQPTSLIQRFWQPLCVAAMNTPVHEACAQLFAHVLRDSLGGRTGDTDLIIPRVDLSALWPDRLAARAASSPTPAAPFVIRRGHTVRHLSLTMPADDMPTLQVDGTPYRHVIVAGNVPATARLLRTLPDTGAASADWQAMLAAFRFIPIGTLTLSLAEPWGLDAPLLMLADDPARDWHGQCLFDHHARLPNTPRDAHCGPSLASVVVSDARPLQGRASADIAAALTAQLHAQSPASAPMPAVNGHEWILEKRATFAAVPGLRRPGNTTPWPGVFVAGDWTDTGYPGVLEGAVRSGREAAARLLATRGPSAPGQTRTR